MKNVPLPFRRRTVLVCTNARGPDARRPSCGHNGGAAFRDRLKAAVKARGLKSQVMVCKTSCLGYCPARGITVGFPLDDRWLTEVVEDDFDEVLEHALGDLSEG